MVVAVGECIDEAPIRGLLVLRGPSVYIHSVGLCRECHSIGYGGEWSRLGVFFVVGRSIWRSFAMVGDGVRGMLVIEFYLVLCCVDSLTSQESMLPFVV